MFVRVWVETDKIDKDSVKKSFEVLDLSLWVEVNIMSQWGISF